MKTYSDYSKRSEKMSTAAIVRCIHYARGSLTNIPYQRQLLILTRRISKTGVCDEVMGGGGESRPIGLRKREGDAKEDEY